MQNNAKMCTDNVSCNYQTRIELAGKTDRQTDRHLVVGIEDTEITHSKNQLIPQLFSLMMRTIPEGGRERERERMKEEKERGGKGFL